MKKSDLRSELETACDGMFYLSETDAEILPFFYLAGEDSILDALLQEQEITGRSRAEEMAFNDFFARLSKIREWFGTKEMENANRFGKLKKLLENNLSDLKVFRIGKIRIDIYVVGVDKDGNLAGVRTKAVET